MSDNDKKRFLDKAYTVKTDADTKALYDAWAEVYDEELGENEYQQPVRCAKALLGLMPPKNNPAILDVGCGSGLSGLALKNTGYSQVDGCDYSTGMLDKAKETGAYDRLFETNLNAPPMDANDAAYDAVTCVGVFSFGHVMADALDDILRVLKPGGFLVIGMNDHFYQEASLTNKLTALEEAGVITGRKDEHGEHIRGTGLTGWVITVRRI
ncbi:MAG: class I SAM-dependent methyltransferase [Pseudomonadota bacterium]